MGGPGSGRKKGSGKSKAAMPGIMKGKVGKKMPRKLAGAIADKAQQHADRLTGASFSSGVRVSKPSVQAKAKQVRSSAIRLDKLSTSLGKYQRRGKKK